MNETTQAMHLLINMHSFTHGDEFEEWVTTYRDLNGQPYAGGRTSWFAADGTKYDLGGDSLVYREAEVVRPKVEPTDPPRPQKD